MIDLTGQFADFFGESRDIGERGEIALYELTHPIVDSLLRLPKAHG